MEPDERPASVSAAIQLSALYHIQATSTLRAPPPNQAVIGPAAQSATLPVTAAAARTVSPPTTAPIVPPTTAAVVV